VLHFCCFVQPFRVQKGYIYKLNGAWHLRYRVNGKQKSKRLAPFSDQYRTLESVRPLADAILHPVNQGRQLADSHTIQEFVKHEYFPYAKAHKRPSTYKGYLNLFNGQIAARVTGVRLASFRTVNAQRWLDKIATETNLSRRSHVHLKALLSGIFAYAKRTGAIDVNPIVGCEIPKGRRDAETYAYNLDEIKLITEKLQRRATDSSNRGSVDRIIVGRVARGALHFLLINT
jgi:hypothetical protein